MSIAVAMRGGTLLAPEAVAKKVRTAPRFYRPELDVLRLFAFLLVFAAHASLDESHLHAGLFRTVVVGFMDSVHFGLCLFFFLSSYLITELLQMERVRTGSVHLGAFYMRRILRIWPLYFVFLLLGGLGCSMLFGWKITTGQLVAFFVLLGNFYSAKHGFPHNPIFPLWSISVEEQFYVLWPSLAKFGGIRALVGTSVLLLPMAVLSLVVLTLHGATRDLGVWTNSLVQFQFFAMGALLAYAIKTRVPSFATMTRVALFVVGCGAWAAASVACHISDVGPATSPMSQVAGYGLVGVGCICILLSVLGSTATWPAWAVYLGKISYGLYVFHLFCLMAVKAVAMRVEERSALLHAHHQAFGPVRDGLALALTVLLAHVSYRYLETPFLKLKERFTFVKSRAV